MKKKLVNVLMVSALAFSMTACGSASNNAPSENSEVLSEVQDETADESADAEEEEESQAEDYGMAETVLFENELCRITATSAGLNETGDFILGMRYENLTDAEVEFILYTFFVDGFEVFAGTQTEMGGSIMSETPGGTVAAGETLENEIIIDKMDLDMGGITSVDELRIDTFYLDQNGENLVSDGGFYLYPTGLTAETVVYPEIPTGEGAKVLVDNDQLTFSVLGVTTNDAGVTSLKFYCENKTDNNVTFNLEDWVLNGTEHDNPYISVYPHSRVIDSMIGTESIDSMSCTLQVKDFSHVDQIYFEQALTY